MAKKKKTMEELLEEAMVPEEEQKTIISMNWEWVRLGNVIELISGRDISSKHCNIEGIGIPYIMGASNIDENELNIERWIEEPTVIGKKGDILVSVKGTIGKTVVLNIEAAHLSRQIMAIRNKNIVDRNYLYYFIRIYVNQLKESAKGIIPGISRNDILNAPFPLSPLNEQKRIADKVERLLTKIDEAKQLIEEAKESFELRRAAILDKAFRGELTREWRSSNLDIEDAESLYKNIKEIQQGRRKKLTNITDEEKRFELPLSWKWVRLGDVFNITSGGTPKRTNEEYYNGNIPWIKTGEVKWNVIDDSIEKITEVAIKNSSAKILPKNTVLVAMYGQGLTRGRAAILNIEASCNQAVCALLPNEFIIPKYLYYYFMEGYNRFRKIAKGGNQENLSATVISEFSFPLPPYKEQLELINLLDSIFEKEHTGLENIEMNNDNLKQSILSKAFKGELGTNDPTEENAIELLKEVLQEKQ